MSTERIDISDAVRDQLEEVLARRRTDRAPVDVTVEHCIRVTSPSTGVVNDGPIVKTHTWAEAMQAAYDWGRVDGQHREQGKPLFGEDKEWTVSGVPLAQLRSKLGSARRDG